MIAVCKSIHHGDTETRRRGSAERQKQFLPVFAPGVVESAAVADVHDIAILHDVVLTLQTERAFGARVGF
jgi:hypothetical protein